ncbi:DUF397 domain-containing protein [Micromonospora sp. NBRC 101691]|uniref:DUF397 domain-containing protein n=1 Tax=Micromonospora TaxID=1873 RepID=UPI0024A42984|nr:DUF397 domain-containing protein [Micromonospora sp. NBRC 101691]GLY20860.1 hypothetical protein Misp04_05920 [Micromonospora sp. NBRC 101691]
MSTAHPVWRTATRSNTNGGECVEVADNLPGVVLVRDSKDRDGGTLAVDRDAWRAFVAHARATG